MKHSPRFEKLAADAQARVKEIDVQGVKKKLDSGASSLLIDVREESEWAVDHLPKATHLGKGIIERDIEKLCPDLDKEIILYCGGGFRSALAAESLEKMGYRNVLSMAGGIRAWREAGLPLIK